MTEELQLTGVAAARELQWQGNCNNRCCNGKGVAMAEELQ